MTVSNLINNLPRIARGIRLWRKNPGAKLILTGAAAQNNPTSSAAVATLVALSLGVPSVAIITLDEPRDIHQEAVAIGQAPFLLVTSANQLAIGSPLSLRTSTAVLTMAGALRTGRV